jgi:hypothetical protein
VILSNIGLLAAGLCVKLACNTWGALQVLKLYGVPWLLVTHWFITITYLQHTDPSVPHYRDGAWTFQRGAASTVDRNFLGWQGRFFLHDVAHYHVVHHFFPKMPHCKFSIVRNCILLTLAPVLDHGEEATGYLKKLLGEHYHSSSDPIFATLWHNYNVCQFVEDKSEFRY